MTSWSITQEYKCYFCLFLRDAALDISNSRGNIGIDRFNSSVSYFLFIRSHTFSYLFALIFYLFPLFSLFHIPLRELVADRVRGVHRAVSLTLDIPRFYDFFLRLTSLFYKSPFAERRRHTASTLSFTQRMCVWRLANGDDQKTTDSWYRGRRRTKCGRSLRKSGHGPKNWIAETFFTFVHKFGW